jgi:hypothetical protein
MDGSSSGSRKETRTRLVGSMADGVHEFGAPSADEALRPEVLESRPSMSSFSCFAIGLAAAVLGLLPWILTGMRLPLQNLWVTATAPEDMPIALLPLSQYSTTLIPGLLITGSAIAGLVARLLGSRMPKRGTMLIALAVLLVYAVAGMQASIVVADGLEHSDPAKFYLAALVIVAILSIALALAVLLLISRAPVAGATIGLSVGALAAGIYVNSLIAPIGGISTEVTTSLLGLAGWVPAVLVGVAIGWCGVRTAGRIVAVVVSLLGLWIGPAALTAISSATGTRVLLPYPSEMLDYGFGVFRMAASLPELVLPPLITAVIVGVVAFVVRRLHAKRRDAAQYLRP